MVIDIESGLLNIEDVQLEEVKYLVKAGFAGLPLADHGSFPKQARRVLGKYIKELVNDVVKPQVPKDILELCQGN